MSDKPGKNSDGWREDESTVSRAYGKLKQPQPPSHLDDQILAAARHAVVDPQDTVIRVQRWRKWTLPAALAATVVFAVPLVIRVFENATPTFDAAQTARMMETENRPIEPELVEPDERLAELVESQSVRPNAPYMDRPKPPPVPDALDGSIAEPVYMESAQPQLRDAAETDSAALAKMSTIEPAADVPIPPSTINSQRAAQPAAMADSGFAASPPGLEERQATAALAEVKREMADAATLATERDEQAARQRYWTNSPANINEVRADAASADENLAAAAESSGYAAAPMAADTVKDSGVEEVLLSGTRAAEQWLIDIAELYRDGPALDARRELGHFLNAYPDYDLPEDYPLESGDAIYENTESGDSEIIPQARSWLKGIGAMAERGQIDQARTQLAKFFKLYPDYPLPADFPLTREDAEPIER